MPYSIQTIGLNLYELHEVKLTRSPYFQNCLKFLLQTEKWDTTQFVEYQNKLLRKMVVYAYKHVPFYHKLYKKNSIDIYSIKTIESLDKLPIIQRSDVIDNYANFFARDFSDFRISHTSGTTGTPLTLRIPKKLNIFFKALAYRRDLWAGFKEGEWKARFVGDTPIKNCQDKTLFRPSYVKRRLIFSSYCLNKNNLHKIFPSLYKYNINYLHSYPSTAYLLAKYLEFSDIYYPIKAHLYSSETLNDYQRKLIEDRFKTKCFGFYGQAERVSSATECEAGNYHFTMVDGITEIIKDGERVAEGELGLSVTTSLHNYAMPLIRYSLNDYLGYKSDCCICGRTSPLCSNIKTKCKEDYIITPDLRLISPSLITFPLKNSTNIYESQVVQKNIGKVEIIIVPNSKFCEIDELNLITQFKNILGNEIDFELKKSDMIKRSNSFKKKFVINELGDKYLEKKFNESLET